MKSISLTETYESKWGAFLWNNASHVASQIDTMKLLVQPTETVNVQGGVLFCGITPLIWLHK